MVNHSNLYMYQTYVCMKVNEFWLSGLLLFIKYFLYSAKKFQNFEMLAIIQFYDDTDIAIVSQYGW